MLLAHEIQIPKRIFIWNNRNEGLAGAVLSHKVFTVKIKLDNGDIVERNLRCESWASLDLITK